jgi:hypothetical protein
LPHSPAPIRRVWQMRRLRVSLIGSTP